MATDWPLAPTRRMGSPTKVIKPLLAKVGETDLRGRGSHTLRRTAANLILDATGDIEAARQLLGHASVNQTEQYLDQDARRKRYENVIREWSI